MPTRMLNWRVFWAFWLTGLGLFFLIAASNSYLVTPMVPAGIIDHQSAATAARVDAIHASWKEAGVNGFATASMVIDLIFIGVYAVGGTLGAILIQRSARQRGLRVFGGFIFLAYLIFALLDYSETISELVQQLSSHGNGTLAMIAAAVRPLKMFAFLAASVATIIALIWYRLARQRNPRGSGSI